MLKILSLLMFILIANNARAAAGSTGMGNGGDVACEDRFNSIRDDIASWINNGGSTGLTLPTEIALAHYNQEMLKYISDPNDLPHHPFKATVQCVSSVVMVDGAEKTCKNEIDSKTNAASITCNIDRFTATDGSDQYVLVHHEYAGLAGFEENSGTESDYVISNQISGYLQNEVVKKLAVKPNVATGDTYTTSVGAIFQKVWRDGFGVGWMDPNGKIWGAYQGEFLNQGPSNAGTIIDSSAIKACASIGGKLPTELDYRQLEANFDMVEGHFTDQGTKDFVVIFPKGNGNDFWTRTASSNPEMPVAFASDSGYIRVDFGDTAASVQCLLP